MGDSTRNFQKIAVSNSFSRANLIKYVALDLDGTLLNKAKVIDCETTKYIKEKVSHGISFILVSGRHLYEMVQYAHQLDLDDKSILISCDGEYIHMLDGSLVWESKKLTNNDVIFITCHLSDKKLLLISSKRDVLYVRSKLAYCLEKAKAVIKKRNYEIRLRLTGIENIEKIVSYNINIEDSLEMALSNKYRVQKLEEGRVEFLPFEINKYNALLVLNRLGLVELKSMLYIGNDFNDFECIKNIKKSCCMDDSPQQLKDLSSYVTDDCNNQGVLKALKHFFQD